MKHAVRHIIIPAIMPILFLITASTPVEILGCRTRGLIALAIALVSGLAALGTAMIGARRRMKGAEDSVWWLGSTLILVVPVVGLVILA
jgi:hypothetical protein